MHLNDVANAFELQGISFECHAYCHCTTVHLKECRNGAHLSKNVFFSTVLEALNILTVSQCKENLNQCNFTERMADSYI